MSRPLTATVAQPLLLSRSLSLSLIPMNHLPFFANRDSNRAVSSCQPTNLFVPYHHHHHHHGGVDMTVHCAISFRSGRRTSRIDTRNWNQVSFVSLSPADGFFVPRLLIWQPINNVDRWSFRPTADKDDTLLNTHTLTKLLILVRYDVLTSAFLFWSLSCVRFSGSSND